MALGSVDRTNRETGETVMDRSQFIYDANLVMTPRDTMVRITLTGANNSAVTLPSVSESAGGIFVIRLLARGSGAVTISDKANDATFSDVTLNAAEEYTVLYSDGLSWYTLDSSLSL
jgi:hypothetical protein